MIDDPLSYAVIGAALEVHSELGPGLLESTYEHCLAAELASRGISFEQQKSLPVRYKGEHVECGYRIDLLIEGTLIVEVKSVVKLLPVHLAQLNTYLRLTGCRTGLLMNFNSVRLRDGMERVVWRLPEPSRPSRPSR